MDQASRRILASLASEQRVAALGTIYQGAPLVSLVPFSASPDLSAFDVHVSRLAQHTQGLLGAGRVGLMLFEPDRPTRNPQTLPRLSLQGLPMVLDPTDPGYHEARSRYLAKFPAAEISFQLPDFLLVRIVPESARLVTGFGKIFDLDAQALTSAGPA
jgi:putative heme iron utilization protein